MTTVFPLPSPTLPDFTTLLLKGPYHASAPIHLCLSHLANRPGSRAVLLTPSRENFIAALRDFNDDWLNECGGYGTVSQILSRVDVFYPPTASQASIVLSMLRDAQPETAPSQLEIASPSLVLLHEFSSYFLDGEESGSHSIASYLSLVAHALTTLKSWSEQASLPHVSLVLMDSRLDALNLPVLKPHIQGPRVAELEGPNDPPYRVAFLMHHYFEWLGTFEIEETPHSATAGPSRCMLRLRDTLGGTVEVDMKWRRMNGQARPFSRRPGVIFIFEAL